MSSTLAKNLMKKSIPPLPPEFSKTDRREERKKRDYSPLCWSEFFDEKQYLSIGSERFNVYLKGKTGLLFFLIHGGGYSGLTWACFAEEISKRIDCRIVAPDLRGHGETETTEDYNLSVERQLNDISLIYNILYPTDPPPVFVMGHSMGGALSVHLTSQNLIPNLLAVAVIDVVEGSAMDALSGMANFLRGRPSKFKSPESAIEWCLKTAATKNERAARISMPSQIRKCCTDEFTVDEFAEEGGSETATESSTKVDGISYEWRIDLNKSEPFWAGWFKDLSSLFLSVSAPKLLILAGVDRLDKTLTVGQMQGKFQMIVLPRVGHVIHEDSPDKLADVLTTFCVRNRFTQAHGDYQPIYPGC